MGEVCLLERLRSRRLRAGDMAYGGRPHATRAVNKVHVERVSVVCM